jgi:hypothetical protein
MAGSCLGVASVVPVRDPGDPLHVLADPHDCARRDVERERQVLVSRMLQDDRAIPRLERQVLRKSVVIIGGADERALDVNLRLLRFDVEVGESDGPVGRPSVRSPLSGLTSAAYGTFSNVTSAYPLALSGVDFCRPSVGTLIV